MIDLTAVLNLEDNLSGPLGAINSKLTSFVGFAAITGGATAAVKGFADFDTSIRKASVIAGATGNEMKLMSDAAKQLGADTSLGATEVADAMSEMAAKGYNASQTIAAMPGIIAGAEASGEDLALVADTVSTAINIWGMEASEASRVSDILAMTANKTAAGVSDMQYALKYAGAPAKALGMSLEEVAAAAGIMVDAGLDGSSAGTALRAGLGALAGGTDVAKKKMKAIGFSAVDATGNMKSMSEVVASLNKSMDGMNGTEKAVMVKELVGQESMSAFLALMDAGPAKVKALQTELENSAGAAQTAADLMKAGIGGALEQMGGQIETVKLNFGEMLVPLVEQFANFVANADLTPLYDGFDKVGVIVKQVGEFFSENWETITSTLALVAYGLVGVKVAMMAINGTMAIINGAIAVFKALKATIAAVRTAQLFLNAAMLANPIGAVIIAITALVAIGIVLYKNWDKVKASMSSAWNSMKTGKGVLLTVLGPIGQMIKFAVTLKKNWISTESVWSNVWSAMKVSAADTVNVVIDGINKMITLINKLPGVNIPVVAKVDWGNEATSVASKVYTQSKANSQTQTGTAQALGNHAGISDINGTTIRKLHDGERVLTAMENANYKEIQRGNMTAVASAMNSSAGFKVSGNSAGNTTNIAPVFHINATVREEADIEKIAGAIASKITAYA